MTRPDAERRLLRADRALPGLACLLDAEELAEGLRHHGARIGGHFLIDYLRYKPGENCIARFRYGEDGAMHWGYAKAHGDSAPAKLAKSGGRPDLGSAAGPGRLQLADLQTEVLFLPNDNRLPSVGRTGQPDFGRLLRRLFKEDPGQAQGELSVLNYKPERRLTARLARVDGTSSVLKFFAAGQFSSTRAFHKGLRRVPGVRLPTLTGGSKAHRVMVFDWMTGRGLDEALRAGEVHGVTLAAEALARFHATPQPRLSRQDPDDVNRHLHALARGLAAIEPGLGAQAAALAAELSAWAERQPRAGQPVHGDFNPAQVIVGSAGTGLIDCDRASLGHPAGDLGSFLARLQSWRLDGRLNRVTALEAERLFLDAYREAAPAADLASLDGHVALGLFRLLHHPFRERADDWPARTEALLDGCRQRLHGLGKGAGA